MDAVAAAALPGMRDRAARAGLDCGVQPLLSPQHRELGMRWPQGPCRAALRQGLLACALLGWSAAGHCDTPAADAPAPLAGAVLAFKQTLLDAQLASRPLVAESPEFVLYLGSSGEALSLRGLRVWIDEVEQPLLRSTVEIAELEPLARERSLVTLTAVPVSPGAHRLRLQVQAAEAGQTASIQGELQRELLTTDAGHRLELRLRRPGTLDARSLSLIEWLPGAPRRGFVAQLAGQIQPQGSTARYVQATAADPVLREARHRLDQGQAWSALQQLERYRAALPEALQSSPDLKSLLAQGRLAAGLPEASSGGVLLNPEALLAVAESRHRLGDDEGSLQALSAIPSTAAPALRQRTGELRALRLLALQRDREAADLLAGLQADPVKLVTSGPQDIAHGLLLQYNLGIALMRSGRVEQGRGVLDRLGQFPAVGEAALALRDKANLTLGWSFLRDAQGATARPILERVRLEGPSSSRALLGLGWAGLAPQGARQTRNDPAASAGVARDTPKFVLNVLQRRGLIDCEEFNRRAVAPPHGCSDSAKFGRGDLRLDARQLAAQALVPWQALLTRDPHDPAVQEGLNAVPYVLSQLGDAEQAKARYAAAIAAHEALLAETDDAIARLDVQPLIAAVTAERAAEPRVEPALRDYLPALIASGLGELADSSALASALADARDLAWLRQQLAAIPVTDESGSAREQLQASLQTLEQGNAAELKALALAMLEQRRERSQRYLAAARTALSRLYDPGAEPAALP